MDNLLFRIGIAIAIIGRPHGVSVWTRSRTAALQEVANIQAKPSCLGACASVNSNLKPSAIVFLGFCFLGLPLRAQSNLNLTSGRRDVLYAQSDFHFTLDAAWSAPLPASATSSSADFADMPGLKLPVDMPPKDRPPRAMDSYIAVNPQDASVPKGTRFRWWPAFKESLLYTGIMHTFDVTTEAGTRDALNGHWFRNYSDSVSELRRPRQAGQPAARWSRRCRC